MTTTAGRRSLDRMSGAPTPTTAGRALLLYSGLRLLLLLVSFAVMLALGLETVLALGAAVLASALLSLVLLRRQREAFTSAAVARAEQRRADRAAARARLDDRPDGSRRDGPD